MRHLQHRKQCPKNREPVNIHRFACLCIVLFWQKINFPVTYKFCLMVLFVQMKKKHTINLLLILFDILYCSIGNQ